MSLAAKNAEIINRQMERLMPVLTPLGIVLGFLLPHIFIHLQPFVPWLFGLMTLTGALKLRIAEFGSTIRNPLPIALFFVSSHIVMPLCTLFAAGVFFGDNPDIVTGFILLFAGPAAVSSFMWVTMFRGDKALCLTILLLDTLLAPLVMPGTVSLLMGAKVAMDIYGIALSLVFMVVIPTIIGVILNETSRGAIPAAACPFLNPLSKVCLMLVIAANAAPVVKIIRFDNPEVWKIMGLCLLLSIGGFMVSKYAAAIARCNAPRSVSLFFSGGLRNISAVTTIAVAFFPEAAALPALLGIFFQQSLSAIMGKWVIKRRKIDAAAADHYDTT